VGQTRRRELLDRTLIWNQAHLLHAPREFEQFGSTGNGALVVQSARNGGTNQQWTAQPVSGNVFTLHNGMSGLCLDVPNNSATSGLQLDQWTCNGGANQQWAFDAVGSGYVVVSMNSGKTAEVKGQSTTQGASIDQWPGNGGSNQTWTVS
jgi:hypothetical protein